MKTLTCDHGFQHLKGPGKSLCTKTNTSLFRTPIMQLQCPEVLSSAFEEKSEIISATSPYKHAYVVIPH